MPPSPRWQVGCDLAFAVEQRAIIDLQIAVTAVTAVAGRTVDDSLVVTLDGQRLPVAVRALTAPHGGRIHHLEAPPGQHEITYRATVSGPPDVAPPLGDDAFERPLALRPSRYCPSDALLGFALARAVGVPARLVAVDAPGLSPMGFHAVVEAHVDGGWHVLDPTHLAPRASLLRIATGRDTADTALADVLAGVATLTRMEVGAVLDGPLPVDEWGALVGLP
ncbi:MAG: transglutaminase domain-containing protein [Acidimicrobiales bacterium]